MEGFFKLNGEQRDKYVYDLATPKARMTGKTAAVIKKIESINNNKKPNPEKLIVLEGIWAAQLSLKNDLQINTLLVCTAEINTPESYRLMEELLGKASDVHIVSESTFKKVAEIGTSAGLMVVAKLPLLSLNEFEAKLESKIKGSKGALITVLDGLEIPGNIGTIIRSCDGTSGDGVIITNKKTRVTHPKMIRSSQGSIFSVPLVEEESENVIEFLTRNGFRVILADTDAKGYYFEEEYEGNVAIVMGSERYGISKEFYNCEKTLTKIPMWGECDSLNVGIAATIILYEAAIKRNGMISKR